MRPPSGSWRRCSSTWEGLRSAGRRRGPSPSRAPRWRSLPGWIPPGSSSGARWRDWRSRPSLCAMTRQLDWAPIQREAARRFGARQLRPGQRELMEAVLRGRDALGMLPTGGGKSLTYQFPALFLPRAVAVVTPLLSLMQDRQEKAEAARIEVAKLDSTLSTSEERDAVEEIASGANDLIYVTPERLENP